jgi:glycosyltransferase involved in cell wall biosynthesis
MTPKFTVVVPCYNEARNIPLLLERFSAVVKGENVALLLVDNGSSDDSAAVLEAQLPAYAFASSLRVPVNQGYGHGILQGLSACQSDFVGWTHADMQTDPADIMKAAEMIEKAGYPQNMYVKGLRHGRPLADSFFTSGMSVFESVYLGASLWDINAQPNIFHRSFFESWQNAPTDFALDLYAFYMARKANLSIVRLDVRFPARIHGESKWNTGFKSKVKFITRTLDFSVKLKASLKPGRN